ncbi:MAG TPA: dCTP deaminase [Candidatus Omnitrophota bacterium]|nr:dCTP deaminase [Candidatus Omnitrophota bacterium]HOX09901.1 dCTP deaminase [Candidatus Omnitrophota bacterium]HPN66166.1 dCTP deaminase [Candidatus Omnitrophota bacterium]HRZ67010.1 dCTP deaminase [Candidatus Omnitrophota bacterium]
MIKSDRWIKKMALEAGMIEPFLDHQVSEGHISYGLSSFGYDIRVHDEYKVFVGTGNPVVDPKNIDPHSFIDFKGKECVIPPNSFVLARSLEYFKIPEKVIAICFGKSTYCRCGILVNISPLEPTWEGFLTMAVSNTTPHPAKIYSHEGIAQLLFYEGEEAPEVTYKDRKGKYQSQKGIVLPKVSP